MSNSRVYVGGIPRETEERDIERFFKGYGGLNEILIRKRYAFVQFDDSRDAEDAIYDMDGKTILGKRVNVEKARGEPKGRDRWPSTRKIVRSRGKYGAPIRTKYKLIVKNLSYKASWQDLKDFMRKAGEVTYGDAHRPYKNEGVVEFASYSDMRAAIRKLDGVPFKGEKIRLIEDKESGRDRYVRSRSRGHSRSRSRSRSCSRRSSRTRSPSKSHSHSPRRIRSPERSASDSLKKSESRTPPKREVSCQRSEKGVKRGRAARRSRSHSRSGRSKSRSESNSPHRRSHSSESGPRTPSPVGSKRESSVGPRRKCRSRSSSKSHQDGASPDRQRTRSRSHSRSNSPNSRSASPSPNTSRKRSRSTSPSEMPAKRFPPRAN